MLKMNSKILLNNLLLIFSLLLASCSSPSTKRVTLGNSKHRFSYQDLSGQFIIERETRLDKTNFIVRNQLFIGNTATEPLEKTLSVSQIGRVGKNNNPALRPNITQHTVWFEKERFFVQHKVDYAKRELDSVYDSPEPKWRGKQSKKIPNGTVYCFYSQLPECLSIYGLLRVNDKKWHDFILILDSYPYILEQLTELPDTAFFYAKIAYEGDKGGNYQFTVDIGNQFISYHFNKSLEFVKMFWVAQSISMVRQ